MREHVAILAARLAITDRQLLDAAQRGTDADRAWSPGPTSPPIAFHLWHAGRFADRWAEALRAATGAPGEQRWAAERLAARWGFPTALGTGDAGMELPDDEATALPFPPGEALAEYLRGAFADLEAALGRLDDSTVLAPADDLFGTPAPILDSLTRHLAHLNRHLGMIEALRGLRGGRGTATV